MFTTAEECCLLDYQKYVDVLKFTTIFAFTWSSCFASRKQLLFYMQKKIGTLTFNRFTCFKQPRYTSPLTMPGMQKVHVWPGAKPTFVSHAAWQIFLKDNKCIYKGLTRSSFKNSDFLFLPKCGNPGFGIYCWFVHFW